jgi:hypothetical protein
LVNKLINNTKNILSAHFRNENRTTEGVKHTTIGRNSSRCKQPVRKCDMKREGSGGGAAKYGTLQNRQTDKQRGLVVG